MKARGHVPEKVKYWSRHIEIWKSSGLRQKEYCANRGLGLKSFGRWKKILANQAAALPTSPTTKSPTRSSGLIPLSVIPDQPACHRSERELQTPAGIQIHVDRYAVELSVGFHAGTLQALLGMLEAE